MDIQASHLKRVIACNGSISMEASPASIDLPTDDRDEGIAAHHVAVAVLTGLITDPVEYVERQTPNGIFVTPDMAENVAVYTDRIADMAYTNTAMIGVEQNVDFAIPNSDVVVRARPDWFAYDPGSLTLHIKDFKYGWRIVEPFENWTLIAYAAGIIQRYGIEPAMIVFEIVQPRPLHRDGKIREWSISGTDLTAYYLALVHALINLTDTLNTGEHCRKCRALAICPAAKQAGYNAVEASTVMYSDDLTGEALSSEIRTLRRAQDAIKMKLEAYEELAVHRISSEGVNSVPGFNVEQQFGNRAYNSGITPEILSLLSGKPIDEITTRKPITPAAMERLGVNEATIAAVTYRPPTNKKLVEFNASKAAKKLFSEG